MFIYISQCCRETQSRATLLQFIGIIKLLAMGNTKSFKRAQRRRAHVNKNIFKTLIYNLVDD